MKVKVCKFGGSSLADYSKFKTIKGIIESDKERKIVVASAIGKNGLSETKLTDDLIELCKLRNQKLCCTQAINKVVKKITDFLSSLSPKYTKLFNIKKFKRDFYNNKSDAFIISRGEYVTALALSKFLQFKFVDPMRFIFINDAGKFDFKKSFENFHRIKHNQKIVVAGFYANQNNRVFLFNRGGGDLTGAIVSVISSCSCYENFTDVDGIKRCSPGILKKHCDPINKLNFSTLYKYASNGATVFSKDAALFCAIYKIPLKITKSALNNTSFTLIKQNKNWVDNHGFFFCEPQKAYKIKIIKNIPKSRFYKTILNVFMFNKTTKTELLRFGEALYAVSCNEPSVQALSTFKGQKTVLLKIFLNKKITADKIKKITFFGIQNDIDIHIKKSFFNPHKSTVYAFFRIFNNKLLATLYKLIKEI